MTHTEEADRRGCYCRLWDTKPEVLHEQGLPVGFCGHCEKCGQPGHTRHFPGPVPYTGDWCQKHYRNLMLFDPRTVTGCLPWMALLGLLVFVLRWLRGG